MAHAVVMPADRTAQGIAIILAAVFGMAFVDAVVKLVSGDFTIWQVFFARSLFAIPVLIGASFAARAGFRLRAPGWVILRSTLLLLSWLAYYSALPVLDLAVAAVALYTAPIMIALLSALLLGERVVGRQWAGVLLGFAGVIAILRPGTDAFSWFTLLPLLGAALYGLAMVITRLKCREEAPMMLALGLHCAFLIVGLGGVALLAALGLDGDTKSAFPFLLGDWAPFGLQGWALMALLGLLLAGVFAGVARAYQIAPPQIIATFDYGYLVSAAIWGFLFFAETPSALTLAGMVLIAVAGVLVARSAKQPPAGEPGGR